MNSEIKKRLSKEFGATFPNDCTMKIVLPMGALIEENCHTVSFDESNSGEIYVQCPTLNGCENNRCFSQEELIAYFKNYSKK